MICGDCDKAILPGEPYRTYNIPSPSGPGTTVYFHTRSCKKVPVQTTQGPIRRH